MGRKRIRTEQGRASSPVAPTYDTGRFVNEDAANIYDKWLERSVVPERGMVIEHSVTAYVEQHGWHQFCEDPEPQGCAEITREFYANFYARSTQNKVKVRGLSVRISAKIINELYGLKNVDQEPFARLLRYETADDEDDEYFDVRLMMQALTGRYDFPPPGWKFLKKSELLPEAKVWMHFVAARIMPTLLSSEVARKRVLLIYALMTGLPVDIGKIIFEEMQFATTTTARRHALGFPCIIARLCAKSGLEFVPQQLVPNKKMLSLELIPGHRARSERAGTSRSQQQEQESNDPSDNPLLVDSSLPRGTSVPNTAARLSRLEEQLNDVLTGQRQIKEQLNDVHNGQRRIEERFDGLSAMLQQLLDRSPPPT